TRVVLATVGLVGAGLGVASPNPCDVETAYHCARVRDDPSEPGGRELILNSARHSYVDLDNPRNLEFAYIQWIGAVADTLPSGPVDALHLGGGGFTVPDYVRATRPGSDQLVIELDGGLIDLDREKLGLETGQDLRVRVGDARVGVADQPAASYDFVVGDAFGHLTVPWHLATKEMAADIARVLRPGGVYVQNVIDYPPDRFIRAELATVAAAFPYVAVISSDEALAGETGANFVIMASAAPLPESEVRRRLAKVADPATMLTGKPLAGFIDNARTLTDDYAPVDQLLAG
ncbi:MAG TPA: fused MFS/spermidine synthase, partial [Actinoplanes sp.]|nr:fused MFS/spermidine synthase [Actinoplanes sp.]